MAASVVTVLAPMLARWESEASSPPTAATKLAPQVASGYVRTVLDQAIDGIGPLRSAAASADTKLVDHNGDVELALRGLIRLHCGLAGAQGFVTNLGGFAAMAVAIPANVVGVTLVQCHLVAGIAHLRGYDLEDPRVRNAILACMLGEDTVRDLLKHKRLPSSPMALATSPVHDPELDVDPVARGDQRARRSYGGSSSGHPDRSARAVPRRRGRRIQRRVRHLADRLVRRRRAQGTSALVVGGDT